MRLISYLKKLISYVPWSIRIVTYGSCNEYFVAPIKDKYGNGARQGRAGGAG